MKPRNKALHADVERIVELKTQIPAYKALAQKHGVSESFVSQLISASLKRHKRRITLIHVEQSDAKLR